MSILAEILSALFDRKTPARATIVADDHPLEDLCRALVGSAGEASTAILGGQILQKYEALDQSGKRAFFDFLAREMTVDVAAARAALDGLAAGPSRASYAAFMRATEPPRQELIRRLNQTPNATARLVGMRSDLLRISADMPELQALDLDFRHLFASWFNRGFLVLRRISWESPAHILEKIIAYEAVHAIDSWQDLRARLEPPDRRCFAFFHPAMPDEPLIFVEVALTDGIPSSIQTLLAPDRQKMAAEDADAAVFYSISNCQAGLAGISFGNSLIKQVVADLAVDLPGLGTFVTLSPIPGLGRWLKTGAQAIDPADTARVRTLAAQYLLTARRPDGQPLDPVARFHLGNGAEVHAVHAEADISEKGIAQSAGAMVSYLYDLPQALRRHERYVSTAEIAASVEVRALAAMEPPEQVKTR